MFELVIKVVGLLIVSPIWFVGMFQFIQTI
jgi:hypothetical protein